jgi:acyl carrier protein
MSDLQAKKETVRRIICAVLRLNPTQVSDDDEFGRQLSVSSLDLLEMVLEIETAFDVVVPDADYPRLTSLNKIVTCVEELQALPKSFAR